jgi:hypothetical protein
VTPWLCRQISAVLVVALLAGVSIAALCALPCAGQDPSADAAAASTDHCSSTPASPAGPGIIAAQHNCDHESLAPAVETSARRILTSSVGVHTPMDLWVLPVFSGPVNPLVVSPPGDISARRSVPLRI